MVSCLLHSLPPINASVAHNPTAATEHTLDEKQNIKECTGHRPQDGASAALDGVIRAMVAMFLSNSDTSLVAKAMALLSEKSLFPRNGGGALICPQDGDSVPPPAMQQPPLWSYTHAHVRDVRANPAELRMLAVERTMMLRAKITRPLRNRHHLARRQDDFVWGLKSGLRSSL